MFLQQDHALGFYGLFQPHRSDVLAGLALDAYTLYVDAQYLGDPLADLLPVRQQFWALGEDHAVQIDDPPAQRQHCIPGGGKHFGRIAAAVDRIGIGKQLADIAQGGCSQQGVDHGVQQRVAVAVADQRAIVGNDDSTQPQRPPRPQPMRVMSDADANPVRSCTPVYSRGTITLGENCSTGAEQHYSRAGRNDKDRVFPKNHCEKCYY